MSVVDEFQEKVDEVYGIYLDATAGFIEFRKLLMHLQKITMEKSSLSMNELDKRLFTFGKGEPTQKESYALHSRTQGQVKERNKENGSNCKIIANFCVVLIYQYWENHFREKVAKENKVEKDHIEWDIMGDLNYFRQSIIHHQDIAIPEVKKCKVLKWFNPKDIIDIDNDQFEEIIRQIKNTKFSVRS